MKFQVLDIIPHLKNPVTGEIVSTADRLNQVVETACRAEELGFDCFSVGSPRIWHGSATTLASAALAAKWGDPLFTANAIQPRENYKVLIDHYREEYQRHGHDPRHQYLGSGSGAGGVFIADTTQEAIRQYGPVYEALTASRNVPGNNSPFRDIQHAVAEGPALVGSPEQVIDKILSYHSLYQHDLQWISLPTTLPFEQQLDILERFALEVIPAVRAAAPTTLWESGDPFAGRPAFAGATEPDAAATVTADHAFNRSDYAHVYAH